MNRFWNWVNNEESGEDELILSGVIAEESWWGDEITPKIFKAELSRYKGKNITVWINSPGGDVFAASQIYTSLMEHMGDVTIKIDGIAASAASVVAMAGTKTLMSPTSVLMVHNPWALAIGESSDMIHMAGVLDEIKETIMNAYEIKTGMQRAKISRMMDEETWMNAKKALEEGFIDGMLYSDKAQSEKLSASFGYSRVSLYNCLVEKFKSQTPEIVTPSPDFKELYSQLYENRMRRLKSL